MKAILTLSAILIVFNLSIAYAQQCNDMVASVNTAPSEQNFKFRNQIPLDDEKWQLAMMLDAITYNNSIAIFLVLNVDELCVEKGDSIEFTFADGHSIYLENDLGENCDKKLAVAFDVEGGNNDLLDSLLSKDLVSITLHHKGVRIKGDFRNHRRSIFRAALSCLRDVLTSEAAATALKEAESNAVFTVVESPPAFPGGYTRLVQFLKKNLKKQRVEGLVTVSFIIERDGSLSEAKVLKSLSPEADAEALRLINSMPEWTPGAQGGKPVRVRFALPINFN